MATYEELRVLGRDPTLQNKVEVAIVVAAQGLADGGATTDAQKKWVVLALTSPREQAEIALRYLLAKNKALTAAQLAGVNDASVQSGVDAIVPILVAAASL